MDKYIFDANSFIQAERDFFDIDVVPAFWEFIECGSNTCKIYSIKNIYTEIIKERHKDRYRLKEWAKIALQNGFFIDFNPDANEILQSIYDFVIQKFQPQHSELFFRGADAYLIAQAKYDGSTIVTFERLETSIINSLNDPTKNNHDNKVQIPNICKVFGVNCHRLYEFLRETKPRFVLEGGREWTRNQQTKSLSQSPSTSTTLWKRSPTRTRIKIKSSKKKVTIRTNRKKKIKL